eukprot:1354841-Amorphochlora_amoeboformis.AAC.1
MMMTVGMKKMMMKATIPDSRLTTTTNNTLILHYENCHVQKPPQSLPDGPVSEFVASDKFFADNKIRYTEPPRRRAVFLQFRY